MAPVTLDQVVANLVDTVAHGKRLLREGHHDISSSGSIRAQLAVVVENIQELSSDIQSHNATVIEKLLGSMTADECSALVEKIHSLNKEL